MSPPVGTGRLFSGGAPVVLTTFSVDFRTFTLGDRSAATFSTETDGGTFTRASDGYSVQTSSSTLQLCTAGVNRPRIGQYGNDATTRGLVYEDRRGNYIYNSTDMNAVGMTAGSGLTFTADFVAGPASNPTGDYTMADRCQVTSGGYAKYYPPAMIGNIRYGSASCWVRAGSGTSLTQGTVQDSTPTVISGLNPAGSSTPIDTTWRRIEYSKLAANIFGIQLFAPVDGTAHGITTHAEDVCIAFTQMEDIGAIGSDTGDYCTEVITTNGTGFGVSIREYEYLTYPSATLLAADGSMRFELITRPKCPLAKVIRNGVILWFVNTSNYVFIDKGTRKIDVKVGGVMVSSAALPIGLWAAKDEVKLFICGGGGVATTFSYSINGAASVTLAPQTALAGAVAAGTVQLFNTGDILDQEPFVAWHQKIATYKVGLSPNWI